MLFFERVTDDSAYTLWAKTFFEIDLSRTVSHINAFLCFTQIFKMVTKNGGKTIFGKKWQMTTYTLWVKNCPNFSSSTISEMNTFLRFMQKFKMATKNWTRRF